jgi:hypothetical protein
MGSDLTPNPPTTGWRLFGSVAKPPAHNSLSRCQVLAFGTAHKWTLQADYIGGF